MSAKGEILSVILEIVHPSSLMQSAGEKGIMVKIKPAVLFVSRCSSVRHTVLIVYCAGHGDRLRDIVGRGTGPTYEHV